jgi:hypothetical protein
MRFVNPAFLFALSAISIPILIHLFNFRKFKTVYFTNVRYLREIKEETQSKSQLKHLLILLCRILAIAFLVLAFAQPFLPRGGSPMKTGAKAISIYVDNSFSMDGQNKGGRLLDLARKNAREIALAYKPSDQFQLLTNDFEGKHQRLLNREEFLENLEEVKLSPALRNLSDVFSRQADILNHTGLPRSTKMSFLISDFQKSICDLDQIKNDTSIDVRLVPVMPEERKNLYLDSCWFDSPVRKLNKAEALHVRIKNASSTAYTNVPMKLFINGQQKTPASFSIPANGTLDTAIAFTVRESGRQQGRVELSDSPITFDDVFYFSYDISKTIPVLCISSGTKGAMTGADKENPIGNLFRHDSLFSYTEMAETAVDYSALSRNKLIVLNGIPALSSGLGQELKRFVQTGGSLLLFPAQKTDLPSYAEFMGSVGLGSFGPADTASTRVDVLNFEQEIYREGVFEKKAGSRGGNAGLDLPVVFKHYPLLRSSHSNEENLLRLRNGDPYLSKFRFGKGSIYLCTGPLTTTASNFQKHALFVPTLLQIAFFSQPQTRLFYTIGSNEVIELPNISLSPETMLHLNSADGKFDVIPEQRIADAKNILFVPQQVKEAGNYELRSGPTVVQGVSFNYNRKESDITCYQPDNLKSLCEKAGLTNFSLIDSGNRDFTSLLAEIDQGKKLWKLCILLALVFLAAEVLLLRILK